jgi:hypothetical protein
LFCALQKSPLHWAAQKMSKIKAVYIWHIMASKFGLVFHHANIFFYPFTPLLQLGKHLFEFSHLFIKLGDLIFNYLLLSCIRTP